MINRPWISYSLQQDSKDGEEGIVKLLQVREELTALLSRVNGDRWLLKNLKNCVSILDFDIRGF